MSEKQEVLDTIHDAVSSAMFEGLNGFSVKLARVEETCKQNSMQLNELKQDIKKVHEIDTKSIMRFIMGLAFLMIISMVVIVALVFDRHFKATREGVGVGAGATSVFSDPMQPAPSPVGGSR